MAYIKTTCRIRNRIEVEKYYTARYGAPGMPREKKSKQTPEEMARQNRWRQKRDLRRLIELNFGEGDLHVTLTCSEKLRPSMEEAPKVIRQFRDRLTRAYKSREWDLKYIISCEVGERGAVHWHMIVNNCSNEKDSTTRLINKLWARGRPYFTALDESGQYEKLAEYIVKQASRRADKGQTAEKLSYMRSRNLIKPVVKKEKKRAERWSENPKVSKDWELIPGTLINGINPFNGFRYQKYTLRQKGGVKDADGGDIRRHKPPGAGKRQRKKHIHHADNPQKRKGARK